MRPSTACPSLARAVLRLALASPLAWALGCGGEADLRDYSAALCRAPYGAQWPDTLVCDRGRDAPPIRDRYVSLDLCALEAARRNPYGLSPVAVRSTHPLGSACPQMVTIEDVARDLPAR